MCPYCPHIEWMRRRGVSKGMAVVQLGIGFSIPIKFF